MKQGRVAGRLTSWRPRPRARKRRPAMLEGLTRNSQRLPQGESPPDFSVHNPGTLTIKLEAQMKSLDPSLFIGSSTEGLPIARALQAELDEECEPLVWKQDFFVPTGTTI